VLNVHDDSQSDEAGRRSGHTVGCFSTTPSSVFHYLAGTGPSSNHLSLLARLSTCVTAALFVAYEVVGRDQKAEALRRVSSCLLYIARILQINSLAAQYLRCLQLSCLKLEGPLLLSPNIKVSIEEICHSLSTSTMLQVSPFRNFLRCGLCLEPHCYIEFPECFSQYPHLLS
jgi:hypothetical protein